MSFLSLSSWLKALNRRSARCRCRPRRHDRTLRARFVPRLEALEERTVPSTLTVTSTADSGAGSLRAEIAAAHSGDTINFAPSLAGQTITLTSGELDITKNLDIEGPGADQLTVSGNDASRIFDISEGVTATIAGLTLTGGRATDGAGILNAGDLTLVNDAVIGNVAQGITAGGRGGGIENQAGAALDISQSLFKDNQALGGPNAPSAFGGGIDNEAGAVILDHSVFTGNQAVGANGSIGGSGLGGGIYSASGSLDVRDSVIQDNLAHGGSRTGTTGRGGSGGGGGLYLVSTTLTLTNTTLSGNQAVGGDAPTSSFLGGGVAEGGALDMSKGSATITGTTFENNQALGGFSSSDGGEADGGAVVGGRTPVQMSDCTFTGNEAIGGAGGPSGVLPAGGIAQGGGFVTFQANANISNTQFIGNLSQGGAGIHGNEGLGGGLEIVEETPFHG
jgi:hypothetical protein